jgi:4-amino-4-deoxy-L-arabinose transferase-like glycosyltransferase
MGSPELRGRLRSVKTSLGSQASAGAAVTVLSLLCMALALRGPTFGHSEIDWDESAFALVSREILHNHWPFTTVFDDKSIVLYLHFAAAFALFGDNPAAFRLLGVIAVAAAAALVSFIAVWRLGFSRRWGLFLGACYILASTGFGGQAVYSEHFVNAYALLCALLLPDRRPIRVFFSGIAAGLAINCNYLAIFVIAGLIGGHLVGLRIASLRETRSLSRLIVCFLSGAAASTALVLLRSFFSPIPGLTSVLN